MFCLRSASLNSFVSSSRFESLLLRELVDVRIDVGATAEIGCREAVQRVQQRDGHTDSRRNPHVVQSPCHHPRWV
jgi:hypothetical protein